VIGGLVVRDFSIAPFLPATVADDRNDDDELALRFYWTRCSSNHKTQNTKQRQLVAGVSVLQAVNCRC